MKWKFSLPGLAVALIIVSYECYKFSKELKARNKDDESQ